MSSTELPQCVSADPVISPSRPVRPKFHHQNTSDRLRESLRRPPSFSLASNICKGRKSIFKELGLDGLDTTVTPSASSSTGSGDCGPSVVADGQKGEGEPTMVVDHDASPQSPTPSTDSKPRYAELEEWSDLIVDSGIEFGWP